MSTPSYLAAGLVLSPSSVFSQQAQDLQRDLRALGYAKGPIDGLFGPGTQNAVKALQFDLINNDGSSNSGDGSAPVAVKDYNNGTVTALTGVMDQGLAASIAAMLAHLAIVDLGLATCWVGAFDPAKLAETIAAAEGHVPLALLPVGYANQSPQETTRRALEEFVHRRE